ncbi:Cyanovirin-N [Calocera cornea HHB12733]|uniref:Cyanovirin-N n=1 Tax=Calocera cornea HHB12733 TaxID=1353952 RepID=A0A165DF45_9BASI|nr:Cyanovirin-N [Calocera cornea HHB12733]
MQFLTKFSLCALVVTLYTPLVFGQFGATCWDENLDGTILSATCNDDAQDAVGTSIDLNNCVSNDGGSLICVGSGGEYSESCDPGCYLSGSTTLCCTCGDGAGGWKDTCIDLDNCVQNYNGALGC